MPLDAESVRLIHQRQQAAGWSQGARAQQIVRRRTHGLGKAAASGEPFDLLAAMKTNTQARGVLGIVAKYLRRGFEVIETFPFTGGEAKAQAIDLLNRNNVYAQKIYATIPDNDKPVSPQTRKTVTLATTQAASNLKLVSSAADNLNQSLLTDLVDFLVQRVKNQTGWKPPKELIWGVVVLGGLTALVLLGKIVHGAVLRGAALTEAENEAMALADAAARKKTTKKRAVLSIS